MKRHVLLFFLLLKYSFLTNLENRFDFFANFLRTVGWFVIGILVYTILFSQAKEIAGWSQYEAIIFYCMFLLITESCYIFFLRNIFYLPFLIQNGEFDKTLLLPASTQFLVSIKEILIFAIPNLLIYMSVLAYFLFNLSSSVSLLKVIITFCLMFNGLIILYSMMFMFVTLSFWLVKMTALWELYSSITEGARYPVDFFKDPLRFIFMFLLPIAVIFTFPAQFLVKELSWELVALSFLLGLVFFIGANRFFYFALRFYTSASG